MKARVLGITVLALLAVSVILTGVGTVARAINEQPTAPRSEQLVSQISANTQNSSDNALVSTFVFVCPFH